MTEEISTGSATGNCIMIPKQDRSPSCDPDPRTDPMPVPDFSQLSNFPMAKNSGNCVMCNLSESKIPEQNKGVCNICDGAVWVVNSSGMKIKWCKGCKNFRKWIAFGVKVRIIILWQQFLHLLPYFNAHTFFLNYLFVIIHCSISGSYN